jgi:5'(3')-deoxyribonucleotidase
MRILVDVDGVLADFVGSFLSCYSDRGGDIPPDFEWREWCDFEKLPDQDAVHKAWEHEWLFSATLDPYPGAMQALRHLNDRHEVYLVTAVCAPWRVHIPARTGWLRRHAPFLDIQKQVIIASAKHVVVGDVLVDDYLPNLVNWSLANPRGLPVVIDRPWNQALPDGVPWRARWVMRHRCPSFPAFVNGYLSW